MRFMFAALLLLITLSSVDVASAETYAEGLSRQCKGDYAKDRKGEGWACLSLYYMNAWQTVVPQDSVKAVEFYQKACDGQETMACTTLGYMYTYGDGVKQDSFKAVELYRKACDGKSGMGCADLGRMYAEGRGVRQSDVDALTFFGKACDLKDEDGCQHYARLKTGKK